MLLDLENTHRKAESGTAPRIATREVKEDAMKRARVRLSAASPKLSVYDVRTSLNE